MIYTNSDNYVFKRKGNEEQFKINSKIANKMREARGFLREDSFPLLSDFIFMAALLTARRILFSSSESSAKL
jgi:hypothetical protein